jgi:hypothetical protein
MTKMMRLSALLFLALASASYAADTVPNNMARNPPNGGAVVRPAPAYVGNLVLSANTDASYTPPSTANWVVFASDCGAIWVKRNGTAAIPGSNVTDGTGSAFNPTAYSLEGVSTLHFISSAACKVSLEFFRG